jgi:hypothetical protein
MPSTTYLGLVRAYAGVETHTLSLRMRNLLAAIATLIDTRLTAGSYHYVANQVTGGADLGIINTGQNLTELSQFSTLFWQPLFENLGPYQLQIDSLSFPLPVTSPQGAALAPSSLLPQRFYHGIFLGDPVTEVRLMEF